MDYNTTRPKLTLPEYGRNIQQMVDHALTITDREERQHCAETIIQIMASKSPQQKDAEDFRRTLWDHLALISGYKLDVDYPYPVTVLANEEREHPHLDYPATECTFRHYGRVLENAIMALPDIADEAERLDATELIVSQMAKCLCQWNKNVLSADKLAADIDLLTQGRLQLDIPQARMLEIIQSAAAQVKQQPAKKKKK